MGLTKKKTIVFLTGTRADFGKLKALIRAACELQIFEVHIFVTGMHLLARYGYTAIEVEREGFGNIHKFINQNTSDSMDAVLAKTVNGFSDFVKEIRPDMVVIHGDRVEALAGALVGCLNNVLVAHIEGGEVSGTIDESLRHSITKLSHLHLVSNDRARQRLLQMGEEHQRIHVIGSPDLDIMNSDAVPSLAKARDKYTIPFERYAIFMYHPVTTEVDTLAEKMTEVVVAIQECGDNFVVVYPNNDHGSSIIFDALAPLRDCPRFRLFPSVRFEYFLSLMRHAEYVIGNSSAGVREAPFYGVPTVNLGGRQRNRAKAATIVNAVERRADVLQAIATAKAMPRKRTEEFGDGRSAANFAAFLQDGATWSATAQKHFSDLEHP
jgi:UDP-N-acetylglucosamine 2-epimerase (hydrolysing)